MGKIKYIFQRIANMNYGQMLDMINEIHNKTGISKAKLFVDMVYCGFKYQAGYMDYKLYEWYNVDNAHRKTYITRGINNRIVQLLNQKEYLGYFTSKIAFYKKYAKYIRRDWIDLTEAGFEDFEKFMSDKDEIMIKPDFGSCGIGIDKLYKKDYENLRAMYDRIIEGGAQIAEEVIKQDERVSKLYPYSINTYRIVTVYTEGEGHIVFAIIRMGNGGKVVDNINNGGLAAPIDLETGIIKYPGFDKENIQYEYHPVTNTKIPGYQLPLWEEAKALCLEAATVTPEVGYIGWDVAISDKGPLLVEGNEFPGHDLYQMPAHTPDKIGMLPLFRKYIKDL